MWIDYKPSRDPKARTEEHTFYFPQNDILGLLGDLGFVIALNYIEGVLPSIHRSMFPLICQSMVNIPENNAIAVLF